MSVCVRVLLLFFPAAHFIYFSVALLFNCLLLFPIKHILHNRNSCNIVQETDASDSALICARAHTHNRHQSRMELGSLMKNPISF